MRDDDTTGREPATRPINSDDAGQLGYYAEIAALAKATGRTIANTIACDGDNDPFTADRPGARLDGANWFAALWHKLPQHAVHVRRAHYFLQSLGTVLLPNGEPYENTHQHWKFITRASGDARLLDLVPAGSFVDRRAGEPNVHTPSVSTEADIAILNSDPPELELSLPSVFPHLPALDLNPPHVSQRYAIEIWCEKSTMNDVLEPLCELHGITLVTGTGELSITHCWLAAQRIREHGRPTRILYVSDFDPAGQAMPVSVARKIDFFLNRDGGDFDVRLMPVLLTAAQVKRYRLPRVPIKESDKLKGRFEAQHGEGAVELDALEALHPGELRRILEAEIIRYRDHTLDERIGEAADEFEAEIAAAEADVYGRYCNEIDAAEAAWDAMQVKAQKHQRAIQKLAAVGGHHGGAFVSRTGPRRR